MQDVLVEVRARFPLVGAESLQFHARLVARCCPVSLRSASELPEARWIGAPLGAAGWGLRPAGRAASGFSTGQLPRRPRSTRSAGRRPRLSAPGTAVPPWEPRTRVLRYPVCSQSSVWRLQDAGMDASFQSSQWSVRISFSCLSPEAQRRGCVLGALRSGSSRFLILSEPVSRHTTQLRSPAFAAVKYGSAGTASLFSLDSSLQYVGDK